MSRLGSTAIGMAILAASPVWGGGLYINEFGTPTMGTGSAGAAALAENAATAFHNPAGMTRLENPELMLTGGFASVSAEFDPAADTPVLGGDGGDAGGLEPLIGLFYVRPLSEKWSFGINMVSVSAAVLDYDDGWAGRYQVEEVSIFTISLMPAVAYKVNEKVSFGLGLSMLYGIMNMDLAVPSPISSLDGSERRPDLLAAERRVRAAFFEEEEARLARLPRFTLTAGVAGGEALSETIGSLGAGLFAPLFTGGALKGQLEAASADQQAAIAIYGRAALQAFQEVETSLTNDRLFEERQRFLVTVVDENEKAWELAKVQYDVGQTDLLRVLQMQARWLGARISLIRIQNERLSQRVNLHLALGGSFERPEVETESGQETIS